MISGGPKPVAPFSHAVETTVFVFVTARCQIRPRRRASARRHRRPDPRGDGESESGSGGVDLGLEHVVMARIYLTRFKDDYAR